MSSSITSLSEAANNPWRRRVDPMSARPDHCEGQFLEREALGLHFAKSTCKLIINPRMLYPEHSHDARLARLECLLCFLRSMTNDTCQVALYTDMSPEASTTILGNWFVAETRIRLGDERFLDTLFTNHAWYVEQGIEVFDREFARHLKVPGISPAELRKEAIRIILAEISNLKQQKATSRRVRKCR
jgi:hypothetical protein